VPSTARYYSPRPSRFPFGMGLSSETICARLGARHITLLSCVSVCVYCVSIWELSTLGAVIVRKTPSRRRLEPPVKLTVKLRDRGARRRNPFHSLPVYRRRRRRRIKYVHFSFLMHICVYRFSCLFFPPSKTHHDRSDDESREGHRPSHFTWTSIKLIIIIIYK